MKAAAQKIHKSFKEWPYQRVFLTGATGLIGGHLLHDLLALPQVEEVVCLVRPSSSQTGTERLKRRLKRAGLKGKTLDAAMSRVRAADGNITEELWSLGKEDLAWIREEADLFIHCAASTSFVDNESCEAINVQGTRHMIDVVRGATTPVSSHSSTFANSRSRDRSRYPAALW